VICSPNGTQRRGLSYVWFRSWRATRRRRCHFAASHHAAHRHPGGNNDKGRTIAESAATESAITKSNQYSPRAGYADPSASGSPHQLLRSLCCRPYAHREKKADQKTRNLLVGQRGAALKLTATLTANGNDSSVTLCTSWTRRRTEGTGKIRCDTGWTAPRGIRNQQVAGSIPAGGSSINL
jgi:hypothetical protein